MKSHIKIYLLVCIAALLLTGCDTVFDVHPYDVRVKGETDLNAKNIQKIEQKVKSKDTIRFAVISDSHQWLDDLQKAVNDINSRKDSIDFLRENFSQVSSIRWTREFRAPINVGDVMGVLTFYSENKGTAEYELVATRSIAARADAPLTLEQIEAYTAQDENPWPRFSWDLLVPPGLILLALIWLIRFIHKHRRKRIKAPKIKPIKKKYLR